MYIACHECDLLGAVPSIAEGVTARCGRCGAVLYSRKVDSIARTLALAVSGVILFVVANIYPFLGFELSGEVLQNTLLGAVKLLFDDGDWTIAGVVFFTCFLVPALQLGALLYG
jgi:paraquat-inducible protein A